MSNETSQCEVESPYVGGAVLKSIGDNSSSVLGNLVMKQTRLTKQLQDVTNAIEALNNNPEVTKLLELVNKAQRV